jgi:lipopolysaccharide export system permease protein
LKKLDKLVLLSYLGPFVMTFFISLFVLLMQFLWKYIDDLVGKGLEWYVITELLLYTSATLVPLALPLAILVSSIMTFGNMAESYEIVASKSAGISLRRIMMPLVVVSVLISILAFYFSNTILPFTNLKMGSLLYDVRQQKPALSIKEGVFYNGIDNYSIKVGKKDPDGQTLYNVMIYDHTRGLGNTNVIVAEKGKMAMSDDEKYLLVNLYNGYNYGEQNKYIGRINTHPLSRSAFKTDLIRFDLSSFKLNRTNEDLFKDNYQMLNLGQLNHAIDSFQTRIDMRKREFMYNLRPYFSFMRDSVHTKTLSGGTAKDALTDVQPDERAYVLENALSQSRSIKSYYFSLSDELEGKNRTITRFQVEWHRKLTLSFACFILFLIGAPLGAIIRKGGLGLPVVVSICFFLIFHVISISGEKLAKDGAIMPFTGMWLASAILLPVGIFLSYKATQDSAIFDRDAYFNLIRKIIRIKRF